MNITIKITHSNGTVMDISIPVLTPDTTLSAVTTPPEPQAASEPAIPAVNAAPEDPGIEVTKEDLQPTGKRYSSVEAMVADTLGSEFLSKFLACDTTGEKRTVCNLSAKTANILCRPHFLTTSRLPLAMPLWTPNSPRLACGLRLIRRNAKRAAGWAGSSTLGSVVPRAKSEFPSRSAPAPCSRLTIRRRRAGEHSR